MSFNEEAMQVFLNFDQMMGDIPVTDKYEETAVDGTSALKVETVSGTEEMDLSKESNDKGEDVKTENRSLYPIDDGAPFNGGEMQVGVVFDPVTGEEKSVDGPMYSVKYAAKKLGLSHQTVRNYAYEISEHLGGGRTSDGNLLFTQDDMDLIADVYKFCKAKGIKKSLAGEYYFRQKKGADAESDSSSSAPVLDIKDKFLESMYEKMDMLTQVMEKLSLHIDDNSKVIASFEKQIEEQNAVIDEIKGEIEAERSEKEKIISVLRSASDSVRNSVNDTTKKAKEEIIEAVSGISAADGSEISELKKAVEETRNNVKGFSKILARIENNHSSENNLDADAIAKVVEETCGRFLAKGNPSDDDFKRVSEENDILRNRIAELEDDNHKLKGELLSGCSKDEAESLRSEKNVLSERLLVAESAARDMADRIRILESSEGADDSLALENKKLRKQLTDTREAFKNMSAYLKELENGRDEAASDADLERENVRLTSELKKSNDTLRKMAARIAELETGREISFDENSLIKENKKLNDELLRTKTAFANMAAHLKTLEMSENTRMESAGISEKEMHDSDSENINTDKNRKSNFHKDHRKASGVKDTSNVKDNSEVTSKNDRVDYSHILPKDIDVPSEELMYMEKTARSLDIDPEMPDIDDEELNDSINDEWHDDIEELPDIFGNLNDVEDDLDDDNTTVQVKKNISKGNEPKKKPAEKNANDDSGKKSRKKFLGLF